MDAHKNFAYSSVATAPSPASSGTQLTVAAGQGALFPAVPFNATVWPAGTQPLTTNAEIVRVTNISTDTLTITRAQEGTSARSIIVGDQIAATITAKTLTDVETNFAASTNALGTAGTAGAATTGLRSDATIAAFDATVPVTQAFADAAATGSAAFAARRDHTHGMPANPVGVSWTTIAKAGDTSRASSAVLTVDPELVTPSLVNNGVYEFEVVLLYGSPAGAGTPDFNVSIGEDATNRGEHLFIYLNASDTITQTVRTTNTASNINAGTAAADRVITTKGVHLSAGGALGVYWSQVTSGTNATILRAGSYIRYRRVI